MPAKADLAASSAHESVASVPPPPPAEAPDLLRAVLSALLQIACNGLPLHDPTLGTPIGEHLAAEAIAVLQVGRHIFFPTPAHRRDLLLQLLPRAPGLGGFEGSESAESADSIEGGEAEGAADFAADGAGCFPRAASTDDVDLIRLPPRDVDDTTPLPQAILTEVSAHGCGRACEGCHWAAVSLPPSPTYAHQSLSSNLDHH